MVFSQQIPSKKRIKRNLRLGGRKLKNEGKIEEIGIGKSKVINQMMDQIVSITGDRKINLK
jgi:hypothetical protein